MDQVVHISYKDLIQWTFQKITHKNLQETIKKAFGFDGLGILIVDDVPQLIEKRAQCLPMIKKFADLPDEIKQQTEHKESFYSFGWSYGKEKMKKDTPDFLKGSYYYNPECDVPFDSIELQQQYPSFCHPNIWPNEEKTQLSDFRKNIMDFSQLVLDVSKLILLGCDQIINANGSKMEFYNININSKVHKARLLHYFPISSLKKSLAEKPNEGNTGDMGGVDPQERDLWCGWHNDHGCLTALVAPMYMNHSGQEVTCPDSDAGLYIKSRSGQIIKVNISPQSLAFQIGEASCIYSGGILQATPHMVVAPNNTQSIGISRETMAIFMNPRWDQILDPPSNVDIDKMLSGSSSRFLPEGVPLLSTRWMPGITYGEYADRTYKSYY